MDYYVETIGFVFFLFVPFLKFKLYTREDYNKISLKIIEKFVYFLTGYFNFNYEIICSRIYNNFIPYCNIFYA